MPDKSGAYVFVSHSSVDVGFAEKLVRDLERIGVPCWLAPRDVPTSVSYPTAIIEATQRAVAVIVVLSRHAYDSEHVCREVERAAHIKKPLFPIRIDREPLRGDLEYFLSNRQHMDFLKGRRGEDVQKLAQELKRLISEEESEVGRDVIVPSRPSGAIRQVGLAAVLLLAVLGLSVWWQHGSPHAGKIFSSKLRGGPVTGTEQLALRAIVIGISKYQGGDNPEAGWADLPSARGDAEALATVLEDMYGFSVTRLFDGQASRSGILAALDGLASTGSNTAALVCFAGHGAYENSRKEGYWIPYDARKTGDGRHAREDWIWNSTIQKIVGTSEAKHILLIADSCYAGTLFRSDGMLSKDMPAATGRQESECVGMSRYLIASGGFSEVPDGGSSRSAFMQAVIDELRSHRSEPFTARALGMAVRDRLRRDTGREIAVGPLLLPGSGAGQFVFAGEGVDAGALASLRSPPMRGDGVAHDAPDVNLSETLSAALALNRAGATNAACRLLSGIVTRQPAERDVAAAVVAYMNQERRAQSGNEFRRLIDDLKKIKAHQPLATRGQGTGVPRILACIGPSVPPNATHDAENRSLLCRIVLQAQVRASGRAVVVERECLEDVLKEMKLADTDLSDARTRLALGRILQAGVLLFGEYLQGDEEDTVILRLIETETTQVLDSITGVLNPRQSATDSQRIGKQIVEAMVRACPVRAAVTAREERIIRIAAGRLHGVAPNAVFELSDVRPGETQGETQPFAQAVVKQVGDETSELVLTNVQAWGDRAATSVSAKEIVIEQPDK